MASASYKETTIPRTAVWMFQRTNDHTNHKFHRDGIVSCFSHQLSEGCTFHLISNQTFSNWPLYPPHVEISGTGTARAPTLVGLAPSSPAPASLEGSRGPGSLNWGRGARSGRPDPHLTFLVLLLLDCPVRGSCQVGADTTPPARRGYGSECLGTRPQTPNMVVLQITQHHSVIRLDKTTQQDTAT